MSSFDAGASSCSGRDRPSAARLRPVSARTTAADVGIGDGAQPGDRVPHLGAAEERGGGAGAPNGSRAAAISSLPRPVIRRCRSVGCASPDARQVLDLAGDCLRLRPLVRAAPEAHLWADFLRRGPRHPRLASATASASAPSASAPVAEGAGSLPRARRPDGAPSRRRRPWRAALGKARRRGDRTPGGRRAPLPAVGAMRLLQRLVGSRVDARCGASSEARRHPRPRRRPRARRRVDGRRAPRSTAGRSEWRVRSRPSSRIRQFPRRVRLGGS